MASGRMAGSEWGGSQGALGVGQLALWGAGPLAACCAGQDEVTQCVCLCRYLALCWAAQWFDPGQGAQGQHSAGLRAQAQYLAYSAQLLKDAPVELQVAAQAGAERAASAGSGRGGAESRRRGWFGFGRRRAPGASGRDAEAPAGGSGKGPVAAPDTSKHLGLKGHLSGKGTGFSKDARPPGLAHSASTSQRTALHGFISDAMWAGSDAKKSEQSGEAANGGGSGKDSGRGMSSSGRQQNAGSGGMAKDSLSAHSRSALGDAATPGAASPHGSCANLHLGTSGLAAALPTPQNSHWMPLPQSH
jgi:hypothetical protein